VSAECCRSKLQQACTVLTGGKPLAHRSFCAHRESTTAHQIAKRVLCQARSARAKNQAQLRFDSCVISFGNENGGMCSKHEALNVRQIRCVFHRPQLHRLRLPVSQPLASNIDRMRERYEQCLDVYHTQRLADFFRRTQGRFTWLRSQD
jgi:hypothetical protein